MKRREFLKKSSAAMLASMAATPGSLFSEPSTGRRPNVLLFFTDEHHASVLGCAGHPLVKTPNLDLLAKDGIRYERAYCQDGICVPSRTSVATGLYPRTTGMLTNIDPLMCPDQLRTLQETLKENGYQTAAFGKRHLVSENPDIKYRNAKTREFHTNRGWDRTASVIVPALEPSDEDYRTWLTGRGKLQVFQKDENCKGVLDARVSELDPDETMSAYVNLKTTEWLKQRRDPNKPFFCYSSFYHPHYNVTPTSNWARLYDPAAITLPASLNQDPKTIPPGWSNENRSMYKRVGSSSEQSWRLYIAHYLACVAEIDYCIGNIIKALKDIGEYDNTVILFSSDHGDFLGEHRLVGKNSFWESGMHVPFIAHYPNAFQKGQVKSDLVELVDLFPTILDITGTLVPPGYPFAGRSLLPSFTKGTPVGRKYAVCEDWTCVTIVGERYKLVHWIETPDPKRDMRSFGDVLFDRVADPGEVKNFMGQPGTADAEEELRSYLKEWTANTPDDGKQKCFPVSCQIWERDYARRPPAKKPNTTPKPVA
jgi:arylsulfatase A-like enzyme